VRRLQQTTRPDLKILVMSATIDAQAVARYLGDAPVVTLDAPLFPIVQEFLPQPITRALDLEVASAVQRVMASTVKGDTLVFLPGMAEIRRAQQALSGLPAAKYLILPLHGDLPREEQDLVFAPSEKTKIILATNVAESSITIDGIRCVIDSGLQRQAGFSWWSGLSSLRTRPISQASAIQRTGRAGRTGPGFCLRLFTKTDFSARPSFDPPEIKRADLAHTFLELLRLGIKDPFSFNWFEMPDAAALAAARDLLIFLEAIVSIPDGFSLTPTGRLLAELPLAPRLGRLMLAAAERGVAQEAALITARLSEDDVSLDVLADANRPASEAVRRLASQVLSTIPKNLLANNRAKDVRTALAQSILHAYADRVARKRAGSGMRAGSTARARNEPAIELVLCGGGSAEVALTPEVAHDEYFAVLDVQERQGTGAAKPKLQIKTLCALLPEWLFDVQNGLLVESKTVEWDDKLGRAYSINRLNYGKLILSESREACDDPKLAARVLLKSALGLDEERLARMGPLEFLEAFRKIGDPQPLESVFARVQLLKRYQPDVQLPDLEAGGLATLVTDLFASVTDINKLTDATVADGLLAGLVPPEVIGRLPTWLPTNLRLPSGRQTRVHYAWNQEPWVASRLQDFFGLRETPKILDGRLQLTLHLLAPNQRALQVTRDLASFWQKTYPELRPPLARRYPRQSWPENPIDAPPLMGNSGKKKGP
jgi:ATP-dependent helicase HrpB